jgi:hypothetical protein
MALMEGSHSTKTPAGLAKSLACSVYPESIPATARGIAIYEFAFDNDREPKNVWMEAT